MAAGARPATIATSDLFYDPRDEAAAGWIEQGALAVEMEAATILQIAARRGVSAAAVLGVSDVPSSNGSRRLSPEELERAGRARGRGRLRGAQESVTVRRSCARGIGSSPGATSAESAARSRLISSRRASILARRWSPDAPAATGHALVEAVDRVLDPLEALRHRPEPASDALDVGGRR